MAFKRKTRRGSSGNRSTTTYHSDGSRATRSYSSSSTGKQKTGSGGARYTTTILSNGKIRKTITRHGVNGWISRTTKTLGAIKKPKKIKARVSTPRTKSSSSSWRLSSAPRGPKNVYRRSRSRNSSGDPIAAMGAIIVIGGIYFLLVYWKIVVALLIAIVICWVIIAYNKNADRKKIKNKFSDDVSEQIQQEEPTNSNLMSIPRQQEKDDGSVLQGFLGLIVFCVLIYKIVQWLG